MRWITLASVILGFAAGIAAPLVARGSGPTGQTIVGYMNPPTLSSGSSSWLNCGWHSDSTGCVSPWNSGRALDWDDENTSYNNPVYFRGFFARTNTPTATLSLDGQPVVNQTGADVCEIRDVWIIERHSGELRAVPRYLHVTFTNSNRFGIYTYTLGQYINRQMMKTIDDTGISCAFTGSHVHETDVSVSGDVSTSWNTGLYPSAVACHSAHCASYRNDLIDNWTRKFQWAEGS